jgi:hypothetical protein
MIKLPDFDDPIAYLVERQYPSITQQARPYGRGPRIIAKRDPATHLEQRIVYAAKLKRLNADELAVLVNTARAEDAAKAQAETEAAEEQYYFNQPSAAADFNFWAKTAYWTLDEATALSFGRSPARVNWNVIEKYTAVSLFAAAYALRRDLILRAKAVEQLYDYLLPSFFLAWSKQHGLDFPAELEAAVLAHGHQIRDWKTEYSEAIKVAEHWKRLYEDTNATLASASQALARSEALLGAEHEGRADRTPAEKPLGSRERDSLLKLVIGMAVAGYKFDPEAAKNQATAEIASDLERLGMSMHSDTVRKWLGEAAVHLPQGWKDD